MHKLWTEVYFLFQSEIQELERTRESMARELVSLTNQNELIEDQLKEYPEFIQKYKVFWLI